MNLQSIFYNLSVWYIIYTCTNIYKIHTHICTHALEGQDGGRVRKQIFPFSIYNYLLLLTSRNVLSNLSSTNRLKNLTLGLKQRKIESHKEGKMRMSMKHGTKRCATMSPFFWLALFILSHFSEWIPPELHNKLPWIPHGTSVGSVLNPKVACQLYFYIIKSS